MAEDFVEGDEILITATLTDRTGAPKSLIGRTPWLGLRIGGGNRLDRQMTITNATTSTVQYKTAPGELVAGPFVGEVYLVDNMQGRHTCNLPFYFKVRKRV